MTHRLKKFFPKKRNILVLYSIVVMIASYFTYFQNYDYPPSVFWDENYHIASAQKYLEGVMFMETHPPLGKLLIALGEKIIQPNKTIPSAELHKFTQTDYIKDFPDDYSFAGVRFFSAFLAWISAVVFFLIFYLISKNPHLSLAFSSLYIFDNALITHSRAAMLEGSHLFFILLAILYFVFLLQKKHTVKLTNYFLFGTLIGLPIMVKATGAILFLLFPFLWFWTKSATSHVASSQRHRLSLVWDFTFKGLIFSAGVALIFSSVWHVHFSLGKKIEPDKKYRASQEYEKIIAEGKTNKVANFPTMLSDNMSYMANYNNGVPKLDVCKPDENGSNPITWPLGEKSINYRWEKNDEGVRYMYLQSNPAIWVVGLAGIIISLMLLASRFIFKQPIKNQRLFYLVTLFSAMYASYMAVMLKIERVMYLYHYFIPLIFSFILAFLIFNYIFEETLLTKTKKIYAIIAVSIITIIWSYHFFSPFSYYKPLTTDQFKQRMWFDFWKLEPVK